MYSSRVRRNLNRIDSILDAFYITKESQKLCSVFFIDNLKDYLLLMQMFVAMGWLGRLESV